EGVFDHVVGQRPRWSLRTAEHEIDTRHSLYAVEYRQRRCRYWSAREAGFRVGQEELHSVAVDIPVTKRQQLRDPSSGEDRGANDGNNLLRQSFVGLRRIQGFLQCSDLTSSQQPLAALDLRLGYVFERIAQRPCAQLPSNCLAEHVMQEPIE